MLRDAGVRTQLHTERKKFKVKMNYANKLRVPFVVIIGEDEMREGLVSLKDMDSGTQEKLSPAEAAQRIRAAVEQKNGCALIAE